MLTQPDAIHWCDGSAEEYDRLCQDLVDAGTFERLSDAKRPNSVSGPLRPRGRRPGRGQDLHLLGTRGGRRADQQLARPGRDAGGAARPVQGLDARAHHVRGPLLDGPAGLDDRPHRRPAHGLRIRGGVDADHDADGQGRPRRAGRRRPVRPLPALGWRPAGAGRQEDVPWPCDAENKYIVHFPESREIWSYGSGYGGNALLGKKCFALRIASVMARDEGWMAEHMLILKLTSPEGEVRYVDGRLPVGLREDQPGDADPDPPGLDPRNGRRRHRLDEVRRRRAPPRRQPGGRVLRGRPQHEPQDQPQRDGDDRAQLDLHQLRAHRRRRHLVGGDDRRGAGARDRLEGATTGPRPRRSRRRTRTRASPPRPRSVRASPTSGRTRPACRSTPSCSAVAAPRSCRW